MSGEEEYEYGDGPQEPMREVEYEVRYRCCEHCARATHVPSEAGHVIACSSTCNGSAEL